MSQEEKSEILELLYHIFTCVHEACTSQCTYLKCLLIKYYKSRLFQDILKAWAFIIGIVINSVTPLYGIQELKASRVTDLNVDGEF